MRILVVEDDPNLQKQLSKALGGAGYVVESAQDGEEGCYLGESSEFDAVVLDLGLPRMNGIEVLRRWRAAGRTLPVLILTARDQWSDKVAGIDAGADDYLAKPFHMAELLARLRALIRRSAGHADPLLRNGRLTLDTRSGEVALDGKPVSLTAFEQRLLAYLMHRIGRVVGRGEIIEHIYAQDFDRDSNTVEVFVGRLRKKLGADLIETVRGQGYRLRRDEGDGGRGDDGREVGNGR
ncbi:MAG: response regulator transcription factor [Rhodospirillaceae bacterium]|nr:response regulator transcription factor [Rhodospirillaceae bacterium]